MIKQPPMPNSPARNPATRPLNANTAKVSSPLILPSHFLIAMRGKDTRHVK